MSTAMPEEQYEQLEKDHAAPDSDVVAQPVQQDEVAKGKEIT